MLVPGIHMGASPAAVFQTGHRYLCMQVHSADACLGGMLGLPSAPLCWSAYPSCLHLKSSRNDFIACGLMKGPGMTLKCKSTRPRRVQPVWVVAPDQALVPDLALGMVKPL